MDPRKTRAGRGTIKVPPPEYRKTEPHVKPPGVVTAFAVVVLVMLLVTAIAPIVGYALLCVVPESHP